MSGLTACIHAASRLCGYAGLLLMVKLLLTTVGYRRTVRVLESRLSPTGARLSNHDAARNIAANVSRVAAFYPGRALCLEQSVCLWYLMRRANLDSTIRFGVQVYPFSAHAWVEHDGVAVQENPEMIDALVPVVSIGGRS